VRSTAAPFTTNAAAPAIQTVKLVKGEDAEVPTRPFVPPSLTLLFRYEITNIGTDVLNNVTLTDDKLGTISTCPARRCRSSRTRCSNDRHRHRHRHQPRPAAGQYTNVATATGTSPQQPHGDRHEAGERLRGRAGDRHQQLRQHAGRRHGARPFVPPSSTLHFLFVVKNTGNVIVTNVAVSDQITAGGAGGVVVPCRRPRSPSTRR
jgi:uncharacterized repeat protein (TIGR01451 family)